MKIITLALLLSFPLLVHGQSNSSLDLIGSFDYSFRHLPGSDPFTSASVRKNEKANLNWRAGLNFNHRLSDKALIKTGIRIASLGYQSNISGLRWGLQHDGEGGFDPTSSSIENIDGFKNRDDFYFIEIPAVLRYEFSNKKLTPYIEAGLGVAYYLARRNVTEYFGNRTVTTTRPNEENNPDFIRKLHLEWIIGFGANYNINDNFQVFGQPTFRYHLTKMWNSDLREHLWSAGLEFGLRKWID